MALIVTSSSVRAPPGERCGRRRRHVDIYVVVRVRVATPALTRTRVRLRHRGACFGGGLSCRVAVSAAGTRWNGQVREGEVPGVFFCMVALVFGNVSTLTFHNFRRPPNRVACTGC